MTRNCSDEVVRNPKRLKVDNDELLNVIFRFKHKAPSDRQDDSLCETLVGTFAAFVGNLEAVVVENYHCAHVNPLVDDRIVPASVFAVHENEVLREVVHRLQCAGDDIHKRGDVWYDPWLPMYGCVVQKILVSATAMKLEVVFVDGWERTLHFLPTGKCVHSAVSKAYNTLHCGNLDSVLEEKFGEEFEMKLRKAQEGKGSKRSAVADDLGHQKTPQFIAAVVRRAVYSVTSTEEDAKEDEKEDISLSPHGRTTDVGQHTGGRPRDTCWPLVQAIIKHNLCCGPGLFRKAMVLFRLKLLEKTMEDAKSAFDRGAHVKSTCESVDDLFFMLQNVVQSVIELLDCEYDVSALQDKCAAMRSSINELVDTVNRKAASQYRLPDFEVLQQLKGLKCDVDIASPNQDRDSTNDESDETRQCRAVQNLAGCIFINGATCSLSELLRWERLNAAPKSYKHLLALRTIEAFMFATAFRLNAGDGCEPMCAVDDDEIIVEQIQSLVTAYQTVASEWRLLPNLTSVLDVEQRRRELLVMWIAFCLVHQKCVDEMPLCTEYNIALNWRDLKVAVLRDSAAITALEQVAQYIREWNKNSSKAPIFHLTNQEPTFEFARKFGLSSDEMVSVYNREVTSWEGYVQSKWREIEGKKRVAAELRSEISDLNQELRSKQRDLAKEEECLCQAYPPGQFAKCYRQSGAKAEFCAEIKQLQADIKNTKDRLKNTIATPPPLIRPLPAEKEDAIQVVFMLTMPRKLEILGNLCLTAQRALAPVESTCEMKDLPNLNPMTWPQFYVQYTQSAPLCATTKEFTVSPAAIYLSSCYVPRTVDDLSNISQFKNQCVNSPILKGTSLMWKDRSGETLNPFKATPTSTISSFLENMPEHFDHLQWMNSWPGENDTRGNLAYSRLHEQPEELEKVAFLALGSLRAFPNQQYRKLLWSLLEDVFPWSHPCAETIVKQSLYQVGTLTDEEKSRLLWKTDMFRDERGLAAFCTMLKMVASILEQTPRSFENVPLLSELAGYVHQFTGDAKGVVRLFARMARSWAETAKSEVGDDRSMVFRQKQSILYGYALLAYSLGPLDDEAAQETCELLVLYIVHHSSVQISILPLRTKCSKSKAMSKR